MKVAIITPTKHLDLTLLYGNSYHMVLAQRFISDPVYKDFYLAQKNTGATVILDNGACELKSSIENKTLRNVALELKPDYLVLPDVLDDSEQTYKRSTDFIDENQDLKDLGIKYIAVTQGTNNDEWLDCFYAWLRSDQVDVIGISNVKAMNTDNIDGFNRKNAIEILIRSGRYKGQKEIHILGLGDSGHIEIAQLEGYNFIEGVDTSAPIVHGASGIKFENGKVYSKITKYLPDDIEIDKKRLPLIKHNISILMQNAGQSIR